MQDRRYLKKAVLAAMAFASVLCALIFFREDALSFGGCEEDCQKCHKLDAAEAEKILKSLKVYKSKVLDIKMSQIRGIWEVTVETKGRKAILYVSFSKKYTVGGPITEIDSGANVTRDTIYDARETEKRYVKNSAIPLDGSLVLGDRKARSRVIVFTDPDCPFCGRLHSELKRVIEANNDIAFYIRLMPLKIHPDAFWKAQSILCAESQTMSLQLLEDNFVKKAIPKKSCDNKSVAETLRTANELGISSTPTMIMPDGLVINGVKTADEIAELVRQTMKRGGAR